MADTQQLIARIKRLPCFSDIGSARSYAGTLFPVLDGVRALGALLVITQHVFHSRPVYGMMGIWLFFVMSGLALSQNWYSSKIRLGWHFCGIFLLRRALRIVPMYVLAVFIMAWIYPRDANWIMMHLTFQWSEYTLWTIKQELLFYLVLPLLMLPRQYGASAGFTAFFTFAVAIIASQTLSSDVLDMGTWLTNLKGHVPFYLGTFAMGLAAGSFMHTSLAQKILQRMSRVAPETSVSVLLLATAALYYVYPPQTAEKPFAWETHLPWAILSALFLLHLLMRPDGVVARILSCRPMRAIGVVSFSYYLLHMPIIRLVELYIFAPMTYETWALSILLTYIAACIFYCLVEKPCMNLVRLRTH